MTRLFIRKLIYSLISLFLVASITFFLMKAVPGDPFRQEQALPEEIYLALRDHYGLNDSISTQYIRYLTHLPFFDFGPSMVHKGKEVSQLIKESFPTSLLLGTEALIIALSIGLVAGTLAAMYKNRWQDLLITLSIMLGISVPSFIFATLLQYMLAINLEVFPIARWGSFSHTILPALSLAALPAAFIARMTRAKLIDELQAGYIKTARSKGLSERRIIIFHAFRNILTPILSYLGPLAASVMTGSFIIEKIYSIPGLGYWFVASVVQRDYPLIMGITVFYCALLLSFTLLVDLLCALIDPRLRPSSQRGHI